MRLFLMVLLTALIVPLAAFAQGAKQVEVINDPLVVEVVNPAPLSPPVRWQLVGFTSATYTGAMGGIFGITRKCQLEFPNSRMCAQEEVAATTSIPLALTGSAWAHDSGNYGQVIFNANFRSNTTNCTGWTFASDTVSGQTVNADGGGHSASSCTLSLPVACCALVP